MMDAQTYDETKLVLEQALEVCESWVEDFFSFMEGEDLPGFVQWETLYQVALLGVEHVKSELVKLELRKDDPDGEIGF